MKPLVIYHANCADGFGAAFAAWLKLGSKAEYIPCKYETDTYIKMLGAATNGIVNREVYVLDFSFPKEDMYALFHKAARVVWLDHHKTAFEMWCATEREYYLADTQDGAHILLDNNKSGAYLAWEYFHPATKIPKLIHHIDDYDRWQFKLDGTKEFNKALWSYAPWSFAQWQREFLPADMGKRSLSFEQTARYSGLLNEGAAILRAHDQNVQAMVKNGTRECIIYDQTDEFIDRGLAANCPPHLTSDVGHELANQSKSYGLCWTLKKEGLVASCSLRSNGNYDVSAIAKVFGGGGHRNAAGFEVPIKTLLGWMK